MNLHIVIRSVGALSVLVLLGPASALPQTLAVAPTPSQDAAVLRHIVLKPNESRFRMLPLTNYINTSFDTAQVTRAFSQSGYWDNHGRVINRIVHPLDAIGDDGGWDKLVDQECLSGGVLPNLTLHLLGNGYDFRALAEWYDEQRVIFPFFWAFLTSYAGYLGNEAIEVSNPEINAIDHIADLYFFNLIGNLMFMSDTLTDFAQNRLQLRNWVGQPVLDVRHRNILNASNNYILRPWIGSERIRPFVYMGLHYFGGVSVPLPNATELALGIGIATVDPFEASDFAKVRPSGGAFLDDHDRLLASVIFNGTADSLVRVNLYPELFRYPDLDLGFFVGMAEHGVPTFGIAVEKLLAVGL